MHPRLWFQGAWSLDPVNKIIRVQKQKKIQIAYHSVSAVHHYSFEQKMNMIPLLVPCPTYFSSIFNHIIKPDPSGASPVLLTCEISSRWPITSSEIADVLGEFNL